MLQAAQRIIPFLVARSSARSPHAQFQHSPNAKQRADASEG